MRICTRKRGVEVRQRLVEEEHLGLAHDGAADGDALALTTGELAGFAVEQLFELQDLGGRHHFGVALGLGHAGQPQREGHVVGDRHVWVKRVALEHHGEAAGVGRDVVDHRVVDQQIAGRNLLEARDHAKQGGLAATRRTDEDHELAVLDGEIDTLDDVDGSVALADVLQCDGSHGRTLT